jgi:alkylation response protein AidB-like acyl-CoA dehydrogenase
LSPSTEAIAKLVAAVGRAPDGNAWSEIFRYRFHRLREEIELHPRGASASAIFDSAARTARDVSAENLPLGIGLVMHLYPLCALRCVPLPWFSPGRLQRSRLLRTIDHHSLLLANAGSERAAGAHAPVTLTRTRGGVLVDGTYDYVSLAHVADLVLFNAPLGNGTSLFCVADLRQASVRIGEPRFDGNMRLSDTCAVHFVRHFVPAGRFIGIPDDSTLSCMAQYQRSWFQLLLGEAYRARIQHLREQWQLPASDEQLANLEELACLRAYALRLLDEASSPRAIARLARVTAVIKLRISLQAQSTAIALRSCDETAAKELGFLRRQPTSDERILNSIAHGGHGSPGVLPSTEADRARRVSVGPRMNPVKPIATSDNHGEYFLQA